MPAVKIFIPEIDILIFQELPGYNLLADQTVYLWKDAFSGWWWAGCSAEHVQQGLARIWPKLLLIISTNIFCLL